MSLFSIRKVTALPSPLEANTVYYVKGATEVGYQIFVTNKDSTIVATPLGYRASASSNPATHIPVFTADPASTTRLMQTRTPAQFRSDIGAAPTTILGLAYFSSVNFTAKNGTGTEYFQIYPSRFLLESSQYAQGRIIEHFCAFNVQTTNASSDSIQFRFSIESTTAGNDNDTSLVKTFYLTNNIIYYGTMKVICTIDSVANLRVSVEIKLVDTNDDSIVTKLFYDRLLVQQMAQNDYIMTCQARFPASHSGNQLTTTMTTVKSFVTNQSVVFEPV